MEFASARPMRAGGHSRDVQMKSTRNILRVGQCCPARNRQSVLAWVGVTMTESTLNVLLERLAETQQSNGLWASYCPGPGEKPDWVTAKIGIALYELSRKPDFPQAERARVLAQSAVDTLIERCLGAGYNCEFSADTDTVLAAFCLFNNHARSGAPMTDDIRTVRRKLLTEIERAGLTGDMSVLSHQPSEANYNFWATQFRMGQLEPAQAARIWREHVYPEQQIDGTWPGSWIRGCGLASWLAVDFWDACGRPEPRPIAINGLSFEDTLIDRLQLAMAQSLINPTQSERWTAGLCRAIAADGGFGALTPMSAGSAIRLLLRMPAGFEARTDSIAYEPIDDSVPQPALELGEAPAEWILEGDRI